MSLLLVLALVLGSAPLGAVGRLHGVEDPGPLPASVLDSARDEISVGRYWHAARLLRAGGAAGGSPATRLLLARAEAGWSHWAGVREILEGARWLDDEEGGEGWLLLARARRSWKDSEEAYRRYLNTPRGRASATRSAVWIRLARTRARQGDVAGTLAALDSLPAGDSSATSWAAAAFAAAPAEAGDTGTVAALLERVRDGEVQSRYWRLLPDARLAAGDVVGAESALRRVVATAAGRRSAAASVELGIRVLARGDTAQGRTVLLGALDDAPSREAGRAAARLLRLAVDDGSSTLRLARILDRAGDGRRALRAYDRARALLSGKGPGMPEWARLARARLMGTVPGRREAAVREFRSLADTKDPELGARLMEIWAGVRRRQGRTGDVRTIQRWLLDRYPGSRQAAEVMWNRASSAQDRGRIDRALALYRELIRSAPARNRAGQARMRVGQIRLGRGQMDQAASVFEGYLEDFPEGRRWEEASYWAARLRLERGDTAKARQLLSRVRSLDPVSYYAVVGAELLSEPFRLNAPPGESPVEPKELTERFHTLDLLLAAELPDAVEAETERLVARARDSQAATLRLAEGLIERGRTIDGINLGWDLRREGRPWDLRLLRVVYPFPYQELVRREARERGLDPIMLAAIIRQESAFDAGIVSHVGAVGLMQVMPATGKGLARAQGVRGFTEAALRTPEVNLHLGSAFFVEMTRRYGGDLPLVLAAYNAGPTRANRWGRYREAADPLRFTERIPLAETRGYVKNVRRNVELYGVLY